MCVFVYTINKQVTRYYIYHMFIFLLGFFESSSSELFKQFQSLANALNEDFRFAYSTDKTINDKYGYKE